jgi:hypothetical protein
VQSSEQSSAASSPEPKLVVAVAHGRAGAEHLLSGMEAVYCVADIGGALHPLRACATLQLSPAAAPGQGQAGSVRWSQASNTS